jgi:hypothetical protein
MGDGQARSTSQLSEGACPGKETERFVQVADREMTRLPPAEYKLSREQKVRDRNQQANNTGPGVAGYRPEGNRQGNQQKNKSRKPKARY